MIDSDNYGAGGTQDTSLVSPVVNLTAVTAPVIRFNQDYNQLGVDVADVDLSIDGGATWATVVHQTGDVRGPRVTEVAIPQAAGKAQVQVRFHFYDGSYGWWWEVDNVLIGSQVTCVPVNGGLVVGNVKDKNDNSYVNGATVTSDDRPAEKATTVATPDDPGLADGFYWLYSSLTGTHKFTAKAGNYVSQSKQVNVEADWATTANFVLAAGRLSVTPTQVSATVKMPTGKANKTFTVTNTGGAPVDVEFSERDGGFEILKADGSKVTKQQILGASGAPEQRLNVPTSVAAKASGKAPTAIAAATGPQAAPWTDITDYPINIMDNRVVSLDGKVYSIGGGDGSASTTKNFVYDPAALTWAPIADLPGARNAMTVGVLDGKIIATGGWAAAGPDSATWSYEPGANSWTELADNPARGRQPGRRSSTASCTPSAAAPPPPARRCRTASSGTTRVATPGRRSPATRSRWPSPPAAGSTAWSTAPAATTARRRRSPATPTTRVPTCGPPSPTRRPTTGPARSLSPTASSWSSVVRRVGPSATLASPTTRAPARGQPAERQHRPLRGGAACGFYKIGGSSGSFNAAPDSEALPGFEECAASAADVSWLTIDKSAVTLAPGAKVTVTVGMTANVDQPGTYSGAVGIKENTPYSVPPVGVTMNVTPPNTWGKLMGTVTGTNCQGASSPLAGAVVQVDSWALSWTFATDAEGKYAYWVDRRNNPLTLIVAKDGWKPQTRQAKIVAGSPTVENFALSPIRC
ncbi:hypothetical protein GCM10027614_03290 [Micromonospora vulcania]